MAKHNRSQSIDLTLEKDKQLKIDIPETLFEQNSNKVKASPNNKRKKIRHSLTPTEKSSKSFTFEVTEEHHKPLVLKS